MNSFKKTFLFFFSVLVFIGLIFITLSSDRSSSMNAITKYHMGDGIFSLILRENSLSEEAISKSSTGSNLQIERFGIFNTLVFQTGAKYKINQSSDKEILISLTSGDFLLNAGDTTKPIQASGSGFIAEPLGGGSLLISDGDIHKTTIFSLDAIVKVTLLGLDDNKEKTEVYLYPHMSVTFNSDRNKSLLNADRIRVGIVHSLDYYYGSISKNQITDFTSYLKFSGFDPNFITKAITYRDILYSSSEKLLETLTSENSSFQIPGMAYIEQYKMLFLNETKKKAYLKSLALNDIFSLIEAHSFKASLYEEVSQYLDQLKEMDTNDYNSFMEDLKPIVFIFSQSIDESDLHTKQKLMLLFSKNKNDGTDTDLILSNVYKQIDVGNNLDNFYPGMVKFLESYTNHLGVKVENGHITREVKKSYSLDYLTLFLENILTQNDTTFSQSNFSALIKIFDTYNSISGVIYGNGDESLARTAIYINLGLIQNILKLLHASYFEEMRSSDKNLLIKKDDDSISTQEIQSLSKNIDDIYFFFKQNSKFLNTAEGSKDFTIPNDYETTYSLYKEHFSALLDYRKYSIDYDKEKTQLLDMNFGSGSGEQLSTDKCEQYFSQFSGLDFSQASVQLQGNACKLEGVRINGKIFSFDFFPYSLGEISNIKIDGEEKGVSYKLDTIKSDWELELSKALGTERSKYKFEDFFTLTFFNQKTSTDVVIFENKMDTGSEDPVVRVFKSDKLLGKDGLFKDLNSLEIRYNDILVSLQGSTPNISISSAILHKVLNTNGTSSELNARFDSKLVVAQEQSYFGNVTLQIYKDYGKSDMMNWGGTKVSIIGNIYLSNANRDLDKVAQALTKLQYLDTQLSSYYNSIENVNIIYFVALDKIILKFTSKGENISINLTGENIDSYNISGKNILNNKIVFTQINNYLPYETN